MERKPVVVVDGRLQELSDGDTITGAVKTLAGLTDVDLTGATQGALLALDGTTWTPTTNTTNQIYDGGNF